MRTRSGPPGYRQRAAVKRAKLDGFSGVIKAWPEGDLTVHRQQPLMARRVFERRKAGHGRTRGCAIVTDEARERAAPFSGCLLRNQVRDRCGRPGKGTVEARAGDPHRNVMVPISRLCCANPMWDSSRRTSVVADGMSRPTPPAYKTKTWPAYNEALKCRGSLAIWFDPAMNWEAMRRETNRVVIAK